MGIKHCNTNGRSVWMQEDTMQKNKPHLVTFHLGQPMKFSADILCRNRFIMTT